MGGGRLAAPYRQSRAMGNPERPPPQPSFPRKRESRTVLPYNAAVLVSHRGIPAYAGMTVGTAGIQNALP